MIMAASKFPTMFTCVKGRGSPVGERLQRIYREEVVDGVLTLVPDGEVDGYEITQSYYEDTKLSNILARYNGGDLTALAHTQGFYLDVTKMPRSLQEAENLRIRAEDAFYRLPLDVRAKYNHSPFEFFDGGGMEYVQSLIDAANPAAEEQPIIKEVKADESK